jgi:hypothetical protein
MQINASSVIHHPRARVYKAYRDELPQIAPYMPNIKEIVVKARDERPNGVKLHNVWVGKGEIPRVAQGIIKPEMVAWDDFADWDDVAWACAWQIKTRVFTEKVKCGGTNRFTEEGPNATRVHLQGNLDLDLRDIPGVPRVLAGTITPQIEKFIVALIRPNLEQVNQSLERYLDAEKRK